MSTFNESIPVSLGPAYAGMDLRAQIFNVSTGATIGGEIDSGFVDTGNGFYVATITFDDANGDAQGVKFYTSVAPDILTQSIWTKPATGSSSIVNVSAEMNVVEGD